MQQLGPNSTVRTSEDEPGKRRRLKKHEFPEDRFYLDYLRRHPEVPPPAVQTACARDRRLSCCRQEPALCWSGPPPQQPRSQRTPCQRTEQAAARATARPQRLTIKHSCRPSRSPWI